MENLKSLAEPYIDAALRISIVTLFILVVWWLI